MGAVLGIVGIVIIVGVVITASSGGVSKFKDESKNLKEDPLSFDPMGVGGAASTFFLLQLMEQERINEEMFQRMKGMHLQQMQQFLLQQQLADHEEINRWMEQSMNPPVNPGLDIVIDETFHGINHSSNQSAGHMNGNGIGHHLETGENIHNGMDEGINHLDGNGYDPIGEQWDNDLDSDMYNWDNDIGSDTGINTFDDDMGMDHGTDQYFYDIHQ